MLRDTNIAIFNFIEQHEESENEEDDEEDNSKFLMLRTYELYGFPYSDNCMDKP